MRRLIIPFAFLLIVASVSADSACDGNNLTDNIEVGGEVITIEEVCAYGCDTTTNTCNPSPLYQNLAFGGVLVALLVVGWLIKR